MGAQRSKIPLEAVLGVLEAADPGVPLTASEVADELDCARRTAYGKLEELADRGRVRSKKVGARGRVWWLPDRAATAVERSERDALSQAQLDEFVDVVTDYAIFVLDTDGYVRTWNDGARRIKGYDEAEIVGEHFSSFYSEAAREEGIPQRNLTIAAEEGRVEDEGIRIRQDGSTFWANVVITALRDDDGDLQGFVKVTRDMTERHEYEERLRKEKERFEALVGEVEDYAIFMLDPDGTVQTWNEGARRIKGYEEAEIVGEHFSRFYTESAREEWIPQRNLAAAERDGRVEDEGRRVRQDGSTFWANVVITALRDDDGDIRGYAKITRDMTERHEYEERLRDQRDELDELNRINAVIRDVDQALVTATTRREVGQTVCERLASSDAYAAAWIAEYTDDHDDVTPRAWAGLSEAYVETLEGAGDDGGAPERGVGARALQARSAQTIDAVGEGDRGEPWRGDTLAERFQSAVTIPLVYEDVEYGVLTVYADHEGAFDQRKIAVLEEMGETISHAIDAIRRRERERTLTALQESTRELIHAESPGDIGDVVVDVLTEDLAVADALVYLFDTSENRLEPVSASVPLPSLDGGPDRLAAGDDSPVWRSFVDAESVRLESAEQSGLPATGLGGREVLAIPLGDHGVVVVAAASGDTVDEETRNLVGLVGATAETALDRVESQANLRERDKILQERNRRLQRLNQLNEIIRDVDQALIRATTPEEVQEVVCEQLTDSDRFRFAWIGRRDEVDGELVPLAWSGTDQGYLDSVTPLGDGPSSEPAVRAAETGEVTVVSNVADDLRGGPWRREAFSREFQSVISVPLALESITHGVLTVYADRPGVFEELEQNVFAELGETIANTLNAVETRQALLSDEWVELEFQLAESSTSFLSRLAVAVGSDISFEGSIPLSSDRARLFFTVEDVDEDVVRRAIDASVAVASSRHVASHDHGHLFEAVVEGPTIPSTLLERGASLRSLTVTDDGITVVVSLASDGDVREFIDRFQEEYDSVEFLARRRFERATGTRRGLRALLDEQLTERQLEVLQTAYFSGFFATPRRSTGRDVAEILDVSQPTVTEHLRTAQSKLLDLLLDDPSETGEAHR